ncbi:hypothetical protein [Mesoplasma lactucae]|uniref:Uncharacterized protein n=1 Tax=Mesoplasma lactucae ATCC 49193 TaxID=81460 RepID=A0A291ISR6_9MOLU|nr:hypothetical protein [Mesoplasma lactucae]ATG97793.1 hypothetical protein CP520_03590 [Mesoplasma lactucae ATCC 49193]ATZ20429.1 hypothetical protein MLACT_v1c06080 [Mesoplasma lactucae ATCC 49193]MCL8216601.1 hypothetical protein [Mesoplasma lactucae ATCC 49193]
MAKEKEVIKPLLQDYRQDNQPLEQQPLGDSDYAQKKALDGEQVQSTDDSSDALGNDDALD